MSRTTPPLQQHLLTRSDFARMGVPAAQILSWLAANAIEQVGTLGEVDQGDPVFTVAGTLRSELTAKLAGIGKTAVVLSPLRVRSFLLRAMLPNVAAIPQETGGGETPATVAEPLTQPDLADVLQEAARCIAADVEAVLQLATEEAGMDADEAATDTAKLDLTAPAVATGESVADGVPPPTEIGTSESDHCFGFDDLASELDDLLGGEPIAATTGETGEPSAAACAFEAPPIPAADTLDADLFAQPLLAGQPLATFATDDVDDAAAMVEEPQPAAHSTLLEGTADTDMKPTANAASATTMATFEDDTQSSPLATALAQEPAIAAIVEAAPATAEVGVAAIEPAIEPEVVPEVASTTALHWIADAPVPAVVARSETATDASTDRPLDTSLATTSAAMQRVESFLDHLKDALVEMAQRPASIAPTPLPPSLDVAPLVAALHAGFDRSAEQSVATSAALSALSAKIGSIGDHFEQGVQQVVADLRREPTDQRHATELVITRSDRTPIAMFAVAALVTAWAGLFWLKTGSTRLAVSTLVGANVVGCCLLAAWRRRL